MARFRLPPFVLALVLVVAPAPRAVAQLSGAEAKVAAEALFDEGRKLRADGRFLEAAEKFEQSQKLDPGIGTLLRLADCYEQAGKLASAWANFRHASSMANASSDSRGELADERVEALEPRLSRLTVELGDDAWLDGLVITRNDVTIDVSTVGVPIPLDAGTYRIVVDAPGHRPWSKTVDLTSEGQDEVVVVPDLVPSRPEPEPEPPPPAPVDVEPDPVGQEPADRGPVTHSKIHPGNWVALGLGAGALIATGVGIGLVVDALSLDGQADDFCDGTLCRDPRGQELSDQARVQANGATAAFVVAGVLAGGGLVTFLATPMHLHVEPEVSWAPFVVPGADGRPLGGVVVKGAF